MAVARAAGAEWRVGGVARRVNDAVVIAGPAAFGPLGIAGFLSPQHFFTGGFVVMDFPAGKMIVLQGSPDDLRAWLGRRYEGWERSEIPRVPGPDARRVFVAVTAAGREGLVAEVDTGGSFSEVAEGLVPADMTAAGPATLSASGQKTAARFIEGQTFGVGGLQFGPVKLKVRSAKSGFDALLGMDLLRGGVLVVATDATAPVWLLRPAPRKG